MDVEDARLQRIVPILAEVPGIAAIVLGGSRARGTATASSDYDLGLYYSTAAPLDTGRLLEAVRTFTDDPDAAEVTAVGEWGPRIVGGAWLSVGGSKVDLLYRNVEAVAEVIEACRAGRISMDYQPGHPHGFCSAIWMGEVALCDPLHDPRRTIAELKAMTTPYPEPLREALLKRFQWEVRFAIENAELAASRNEQTYIAGCAYRALACIGQVLFALNRRYLINEKAALVEAARFPLTIAGLMEHVAGIWRPIGRGEFDEALAILRTLERQLGALTRGG